MRRLHPPLLLVALVALGFAQGAATPGPLDPVLELVCGALPPLEVACPNGVVWNVPGASPTIQGAIDLASDGDTVLVAPGTYREKLTLSGKTITLASHYSTTGDPNMIAQTIVDGGGGSGTSVVKIDSSAGAATTITGFTFRNADDGIKALGPFQFLSNRVTATSDGIDLSSVKGVVIKSNVFDDNSDDGIDFDGSSSGLVEGNRIISNDDDGIEIRLHPYTGSPQLDIMIRNNVIESNREDGIQLIDYPGLSSRTFHIHNNLIKDNSMAGLGLMADGVTKEDYSGASIPEPIEVYNNTFVSNPYSITGGDAVTVRNNIFFGSTKIGVKNVDAGSSVSYNLFWNNAVNYQASNVITAHTILADPRLDASDHLQPGSPAIDAGTNVGITYHGAAPDLGAYET
jgi:parallel beta-helix repeat protein